MYVAEEVNEIFYFSKNYPFKIQNFLFKKQSNSKLC